MRDNDWINEAVCASHEDTDLWYSEHPGERSYAIALCHQCPVRDICHDLGKGEEFGIWGGVDREKRRKALTDVDHALNDEHNWTAAGLRKAMRRYKAGDRDVEARLGMRVYDRVQKRRLRAERRNLSRDWLGAA